MYPPPTSLPWGFNYTSSVIFVFHFTLGSNHLTLAVLGLDDLHLFQTLQHAPQVGDAILKGDFLILAWVGTLKQLPHIYLGLFLLRLLVPASQRKMRTGSKTHRSGKSKLSAGKSVFQICENKCNLASYFFVAFSRALKSRSPSSSPASLCPWKQTYMLNAYVTLCRWIMFHV